MKNTHTPNLTTHFSLLYDLFIHFGHAKNSKLILQYLTNKSDKTKSRRLHCRLSKPFSSIKIIKNENEAKYKIAVYGLDCNHDHIGHSQIIKNIFT